MRNTGYQPSSILQEQKEKKQKETVGRNGNQTGTVPENKDANDRWKEAIQAFIT